MAGKHILIGTLTTLIAPFEPSIGVVEAVCLNLLKFTNRNPQTIPLFKTSTWWYGVWYVLACASCVKSCIGRRGLVAVGQTKVPVGMISLNSWWLNIGNSFHLLS